MEIFNFSYSGEAQFIILERGIYVFHLWGASGGSAPVLSYQNGTMGRGAYVLGILELHSRINAYVLVGGKGTSNSSPCHSSYKIISGGFNGGGAVWTHSAGASGGGATDVRLDANDAENRVLVAGGGGGGASYGSGGDGGNEIGGDAGFSSVPGAHVYSLGMGGNQSDGGGVKSCSLPYCVEMDSTYTANGFPNSQGSFGVGGNGLGRYCAGAGGGGGWYGGGGNYNMGGGGGGSSYASPIFSDVLMKSGDNEGDGRAIIILLKKFHFSCKNEARYFHTIAFSIL